MQFKKILQGYCTNDQFMELVRDERTDFALACYIAFSLFFKSKLIYMIERLLDCGVY